MAIRLAKDLKSAPTPSNGFDLIFTEGLTYNLDELVAQRGRDNPDNELVIEVKKEAEIAERVMTEVKKDVENEMYTTLDNEDCHKGVESIIQAVFNEYHCTYETANENIYSALNYRIRTYLKGLSKKYNLVFDIGFNINSENASITVNATADFASKVELTKRFNEFYDKYAEEFKKELENVNEGGLAITDNNKRRIVVKNQDYKDYLLTEKSSSSVKENFAPTRGPVIIWEDGTTDNTTEEDIHTIHDELNDLSDRVNEAVIEVNNLEEAVDEMNEIKDTLSDLADIVEDDPQVFQNLKKEVANKADSSSVYTKVEADSTFAKKGEVFSGSYNDLTDKPEIPSVAGLVSEQFVNNAIAGVEAKIPTDYLVESDLEGYAGEQWVKDQGYLTAHQDISGKVDRSELSSYYTKEQANSEFMTQAEVDARVNQVITDAVEGDTLTNLTELVEYINTHGGKAAELVSAVEDLETNKANKSEVYTKTEADDKFLTEHQSLENYALKTEIPEPYNDSELRGLINGKADSVHTHSEYLTEHQDISGKQDKLISGTNIATINGQSLLEGGNIVIEPDLTGYATEQWVNTQGFLKEIPSTVALKTDIPTVPTNVSAFTNDAGYLTEHQSLDNYVLKSDIPEPYNDSELRGLINNKSDIGHTHDQYLTEHQSLEDYALKSQLFSGNYNDLTDKPEIPSINGLASESYVDTKIADLVNSAPEALNTLGELATALNSHEDAYDALLETVGKKANSEDVYTKTEADGKFLTEHQSLESYALKTDIPTNVSAFTNDAGYLTEHQSLDDYALKSDIPTVVSAFENDIGYALQSSLDTTNTKLTNVEDQTKSNLTAIKTINKNASTRWLPVVDSTNNGKILQVVDGAWVMVDLVSTVIYVGAAVPTNDLGNDGDIYLQGE